MALLANWIKVPAYIRVANDQATLEMAFSENIQREDLNLLKLLNRKKDYYKNVIKRKKN